MLSQVCRLELLLFLLKPANPKIHGAGVFAWAVFKTLVACFIRRIIFPTSVEIVISQYKDPFGPIRKMEDQKVLELCSHAFTIYIYIYINEKKIYIYIYISMKSCR